MFLLQCSSPCRQLSFVQSFTPIDFTVFKLYFSQKVLKRGDNLRMGQVRVIALVHCAAFLLLIIYLYLMF